VAKRSVALLAGSPGSQGAKIKRTLSRLGCSVKIVNPDQDLVTNRVRGTQPAP
jgi:hypothetical protein